MGLFDGVLGNLAGSFLGGSSGNSGSSSMRRLIGGAVELRAHCFKDCQQQ